MVGTLSHSRNPLSEHLLHEIDHGAFVEKPTTALSVWIANELFQSFGGVRSVETHGTFVVEMLFILDRRRNLRLRPDVAFVPFVAWPAGKAIPFHDDWDVAPGLAIEVANERTSLAYLAGKVSRYFRHGVDEVWIIVPEPRLVDVYNSVSEARILQSNDRLSTPLIREWSALVGDIIPAISPAEASNGAR